MSINQRKIADSIWGCIIVCM